MTNGGSNLDVGAWLAALLIVAGFMLFYAPAREAMIHEGQQIQNSHLVQSVMNSSEMKVVDKAKHKAWQEYSKGHDKAFGTALNGVQALNNDVQKNNPGGSILPTAPR